MRKSDSDRHSDSKPASNRSIPNSPHGTPRGANRQASFSHHNVPPIASTVAAAAASLGVSAALHATGQNSLKQCTLHATCNGTSSFLLSYVARSITHDTVSLLCP